MLAVGFDSGRGLLIFYFFIFVLFFLDKHYSSPTISRHGNHEAHKFLLLPRYA